MANTPKKKAIDVKVDNVDDRMLDYQANEEEIQNMLTTEPAEVEEISIEGAGMEPAEMRQDPETERLKDEGIAFHSQDEMLFDDRPKETTEETEGPNEIDMHKQEAEIVDQERAWEKENEDA